MSGSLARCPSLHDLGGSLRIGGPETDGGRSNVVTLRRDRTDQAFDAVLTAAQAGDAWALEHLYASLAPALAGFFRLQRAAEPDDLTSEVFVGVLRNLHAFGGSEAQFRSWVFTIAYRRLADARRAAGRRPVLQPLDGGSGPAATEVDVEADVDRLLATRRVRALCASLPTAQRDVLLLRLVGRMTVDEIALVIGRSRGAVKALQRRGLAAVARQIEREGVAP
jgi:RNA polymerase sigma factor (sigma-70 family)